MGFGETAERPASSTSDLPRQCSLAERAGSMSSLSQLLRAASSQQLKPARGLTIQTSRPYDLRRKVKKVVRIEEEGPAAAVAAPTDACGTAPSEAPLHSMHRVHSSNIDMPHRCISGPGHVGASGRGAACRGAARRRHPCARREADAGADDSGAVGGRAGLMAA